MNNAGIPGVTGDLGHINPAYFQSEYDPIMTNLYGVLFSMQAEINYWDSQQTPGVIVNTASFLGFSGQVFASLYDASKHGVVGLTQSVALEVFLHSYFFSASRCYYFFVRELELYEVMETPTINLFSQDLNVEVSFLLSIAHLH